MSTAIADDLSSRSTTETTCRSCGSDKLDVFLDIGTVPLADRLVPDGRDPAAEPRFPLKVALCEACALVQITETVDPDVLFADDYPYYSSFSPALLEHSRLHVEDRLAERDLGADSLVIELASNDGYLLKNYVAAGVPVLGIDPADGPSAAAEKIGVPTLNAFFTRELGEKLAADGKQADIIHGNNVLAHVADTNGFVAGIKALLKPDGLCVIEAPYLKPLIDHVEFDTIYHEHLCYFSVTALNNLFLRHGLYLNHIEHLSIHGGSLRLFTQPFEDRQASVLDQLALERAEGLDTIKYFEDFSARVETLKTQLMTMITELKAEGRSIAAYGAAAKGSTLLSYCGLDETHIDFVVDRNTHKVGKRMPGTAIPVLETSALTERQPDDVLMLAWNFADEILSQQDAYCNAGGRFIIPVPTPRFA